MIKHKSQEVKVYGAVVGYQFSRTMMGKRTIKTTVREYKDKPDTGEITWKGRRVLVRRYFPGTKVQCLAKIWETIEELPR